MSRASKDQLFYRIDTLGKLLENERELGEIVGYTILGSLMGFETDSGSIEEKRFEQVKKIYRALQVCANELHSKDPYDVVCDHKPELDSLISQQGEGEMEGDYKSDLFRRAVERLNARNSRNPGDIIYRDGLALVRRITEAGALVGKRNFLTRDYRLLDEIFARGDYR